MQKCMQENSRLFHWGFCCCFGFAVEDLRKTSCSRKIRIRFKTLLNNLKCSKCTGSAVYFRSLHFKNSCNLVPTYSLPQTFHLLQINFKILFHKETLPTKIKINKNVSLWYNSKITPCAYNCRQKALNSEMGKIFSKNLVSHKSCQWFFNRQKQ